MRFTNARNPVRSARKSTVLGVERLDDRTLLSASFGVTQMSTIAFGPDLTAGLTSDVAVPGGKIGAGTDATEVAVLGGSPGIVVPTVFGGNADDSIVVLGAARGGVDMEVPAYLGTAMGAVTISHGGPTSDVGVLGGSKAGVIGTSNLAGNAGAGDVAVLGGKRKVGEEVPAPV